MSYFYNIQKFLTQYGMSTYITFGNVGNILIILIFSQKNHRKNSCSLYLLFMTICNLICLNIGILPIIFSLDYIDINIKYILVCRIQFYIRHVSFQMMRTYKVLACIDRFALSSMKIRIRLFSQQKIAIRLIILNKIFWLLLVIYFSSIRTIKNYICDIHNNINLLIYTIYYMICSGLLPPLLIIIFSLLLINNLRNMRKNIKNNEKNSSNNILRKRDRDLIKMVLIEVMFYVLSTMPFSIYLIYKMINDHLIKTEYQINLELFINYLTQSFLMYFNTALPFYIYISTSSSFRREFRKTFSQFYQFLKKNQTRNKIILSDEEQQHDIDIKLCLLKK